MCCHGDVTAVEAGELTILIHISKLLNGSHGGLAVQITGSLGVVIVGDGAAIDPDVGPHVPAGQGGLIQTP